MGTRIQVKPRIVFEIKGQSETISLFKQGKPQKQLQLEQLILLDAKENIYLIVKSQSNKQAILIKYHPYMQQLSNTFQRPTEDHVTILSSSHSRNFFENKTLHSYNTILLLKHLLIYMQLNIKFHLLTMLLRSDIALVIIIIFYSH